MRYCLTLFILLLSLCLTACDSSSPPGGKAYMLSATQTQASIKKKGTWYLPPMPKTSQVRY